MLKTKSQCHRFKCKWLLILTCISSLAQANTIEYFNSIKADPNALYSFFKSMPKGGELHYHLAGGAYAETMLQLASKHNYCIDPNTLSISPANISCEGHHTQDLSSQELLFNKTIRAWSMKDFIPAQESGHDHFFASFFKFMPLFNDIQAALLADTMQRAANQHELYMEVIISPVDTQSTRMGALVKPVKNLADKQEILMNNPEFNKITLSTVKNSHRLLQDARQLLGCKAEPQTTVCQLTVKFQYLVLREQALDQLFAQALNGFIAANQSEDLLAINLVQAEDGPISLRDYHAQMLIFDYLHQRFPTVHIALHAGELTPDLASYEHLSFHINDAITTGHAERIGHGVDIAFENHSNALMDFMAKHSIPVEINLISNRKVLNLFGINHPLRYYLVHHVPVVFSTDDEGILRADLTQQYVEAVINHHLDYPTIKAINRHALSYSFLPGKSLWKDNNKQIIVPECQQLNAKTCEQWVKTSEKAQLQRQLELELIKFEQRRL